MKNYQALAEKLVNEAYLHGGATLNISGEALTRGFAVGSQNIYTGKMPEHRELADIGKKIGEARSSNLTSIYGSWRDTTSKLLYIDAVILYINKANAIAKAKENGEIAIYDLSTNDEIRIDN